LSNDRINSIPRIAPFPPKTMVPSIDSASITALVPPGRFTVSAAVGFWMLDGGHIVTVPFAKKLVIGLSVGELIIPSPNKG
jgi:hypothetical protein